ncbi:hypothetical protein FHL15_005553 [Xylaria flabelliformis]|uniref:Uncharacterized protein n=1 Tax=Xylaria flabelliformis TaxID=2512241 RepID=A0A553I061_9PEZI|nr:hypothetical protein FHL15_005553 [Xylaria flabelliformis]
MLASTQCAKRQLGQALIKSLTSTSRLMLWMLHSAHTAVFALGFLFCCMFGSDHGFLRPSIDCFLFLGIAVRSKYIEENFGSEESLLDVSIICLAVFYWAIDDMFRVALLGVWLPYQYLGINRDRCWGYVTLVVMVPMFPRLCHTLYDTCKAHWPKVSAMLQSSMEKALSSTHVYIRKTIKSTFPATPPPSHPLPTLTISPIIIMGNIDPSIKPKSVMVDSSTQTDPPNTTSSSTQWEKPLSIRSLHSPEASRITILPLDFVTTSIRQQEPSRIRKQRLRNLARRGSPTKVCSRVISPPPSPIKSVMFTPISLPAPLAAVPEPSIPPPAPVDDSTLELSSPTVLAATQAIPSTPIPTLDSPTSLPVSRVDTTVASSSPDEPMSASTPVSMLVSQNIPATLAPLPALFPSLPTPEADPILALSALPSEPMLDRPTSPPTLISVPATQDISATTIPELPAFWPLNTNDTVTTSSSSPEPEPTWISDLFSGHESQDFSTGQSLVSFQPWPERIPEQEAEPEANAVLEAMEIDDAIPFVETFPTLPYFPLDRDELMQDMVSTICPPITPVITPIITYAITSAIAPTTTITPVVEDMIVDEEPVITPESPEVVMEETEEIDQDENAENENENEEEMEDVPDLPPSTPAAAPPTLLTPPVTPIVLNMAPSSNAPKLDRRFIIDNAPTRPTYNIHALDPDYREPRNLDASPRVKEVYVEEFEDNDGYRQKVRWDLRGSPALDDCAVVQLELLMNETAEEARGEWSVRQASIEEQEAIDLAAKKERVKEEFEAKRKARVAAFLKRQQEKRNKEPSVFIQKKKTR